MNSVGSSKHGLLPCFYGLEHGDRCRQHLPRESGHHIPQNSSRFEDSQRGSTEQLRPCWPLRNVRLLELLRICGVRLFSPKRLSNAAETGEYARGLRGRPRHQALQGATVPRP